MRRTRRNPRPESGSSARRPAPADTAAPMPSGAPADGEHNQGGARPEGIDYQRDLGAEQDA